MNRELEKAIARKELEKQQRPGMRKKEIMVTTRGGKKVKTTRWVRAETEAGKQAVPETGEPVTQRVVMGHKFRYNDMDWEVIDIPKRGEYRVKRADGRGKPMRMPYLRLHQLIDEGQVKIEPPFPGAIFNPTSNRWSSPYQNDIHAGIAERNRGGQLNNVPLPDLEHHLKFRRFMEARARKYGGIEQGFPYTSVTGNFEKYVKYRREQEYGKFL